MEELVKVYLFKGETKLEDIEIKRSDFERALDALFGDDEEKVTVRVGSKEISDVTDIILAGAESVASVDAEEYDLAA